MSDENTPPDETDQIIADTERYTRAGHAMQSGVAMDMQFDSKETEPKHLRVGINTAHRDISSLAGLLIAKGYFTTGEYVKALADGMEIEKASYEADLTKKLGRKVTLV